MTWLLALVTGWGVPAKLAKPLLIGVGALLLCLAIFAAVKLHDRRVIDTHEAVQEVKTLQAQQSANDNASAARSSDVIAISNQEQEAHNAIHSVPDAAPAAPSVRLGCDRLRRAGKNLAAIPTCAGLASGH